MDLSIHPSIHLILTFAGLELRGHGEESLVLDVQLGVELGEDEDLRPPVLGVRRPVLQAQQAEAGGRQGQAPQAVAPLLLGPADKGAGFTECLARLGDKDSHKTLLSLIFTFVGSISRRIQSIPKKDLQGFYPWHLHVALPSYFGWLTECLYWRGKNLVILFKCE